MTDYLFPAFAKDSRVYEECVRSWENDLLAVERRLGQEGDWERWISLSHPDGSSIGPPGNPVWDGRSMRRDRAFRIEQRPPEDDAPGEQSLLAWVREYGDEYERPRFPKEELLISLVLTEETHRLALELLEAWIREETTVDEMRHLISTSGAG